jgi:hypothetical protein
MPDYDNTNRGALWSNDRKRAGKKDPDYTGSLNIEGQEFYVDAWKPGPSDNARAPVLSFRVKRKDSVAPKDYAKEPPKEDFDEIPF